MFLLVFFLNLPISIIGEVVLTSRGGYLNAFVVPGEDSAELIDRTNDRYDALITLKESNNDALVAMPLSQRSTQMKKNNEAEKGILGHCILRQLSAFDVGHGFVTDSLHNVYQGCWVSSLLHF